MTIVIVASGGVGLMHVRERQKAKVTTERIRILSEILLVERPRVVSRDVVAKITAKYGRRDVLVDGWGRDILVSIEESRYTVISRGRDGKAGHCCVDAEDATPDTDLIAVDGKWKQVWN